MTWYNALLVTICTIAFIGLFVFCPLLLAGITDKIVEKIRRKKYPDYFKLYDEAYTDSFKIAEEFTGRYNHIKYQLKLYCDGLRDGECTAESFEKKMLALSEDYQELCCWYTMASKYIEDLWKQVDLKAKEAGIKWGIIYDSKSS